jgi:cyclin-dependent kinase 12/13
VKLADFGLARIFYPGSERVQYTNKVVTLWYRAPELLFGAKNYNDTLDIWSVGCVFAEMVTQQVLFQGDKDEKQIEFIYEKCGSVNNENWPGVQELKEYPKLAPKKVQPRKLKEWLLTNSQKMTPALADLIDKMLIMDPKKRLTASKALKHEFFTTEEPTQCNPKE